ncbi:hypothetical protein FM107_17905 [Sphingobacterium sp. JB170]|nr:hypothetical protein FM107_17905 [Sphingobacterium sp. JB170]
MTILEEIDIFLGTKLESKLIFHVIGFRSFQNSGTAAVLCYERKFFMNPLDEQ